MARCDAIVLGAGVVGTSAGLHLAKRGLSVALVDRGRPGEGTSFGNAGVIGGAGVWPTPFPRDLRVLLRVALKIAPEANYHFSALPRIAPWLWAYYKASAPEKLEATARALRPLMARSVAEHEALLTEADALRYLRKDGWISIYRTERGFQGMDLQLKLGKELNVPAVILDPAGAQALEPSLEPIFHHAIHWPDIASVSSPVGVTRAYAERFVALGGLVLSGDARSLHRNGKLWRVDTAEGPVDAENAVIALGAWAPDVLDPLGLRLPLAVKRGYHQHFSARGNANLKRPLVDTERGYALAPMEQGIRLTTGAEFTDRDAPPTPVQIGRALPHAREVFPLGEPVEPKAWMGSRPCFPDMRPVIGPAPGQPGLWLDYGHNHFGLTLGPVCGRLLAEMMTGATPFCDPKPFSAERFLS